MRQAQRFVLFSPVPDKEAGSERVGTWPGSHSRGPARDPTPRQQSGLFPLHQPPSPPCLGPTLREERLWVPHSLLPCAPPMDTPLPPRVMVKVLPRGIMNLSFQLGMSPKKGKQREEQSPVGECHFQALELRNWRRGAPGWLSRLSRLRVGPTLDFSSGRDPRVMGQSPELGSAISMEHAWDSLSLPLSGPPLLALSLSLSLKKQTNQKPQTFKKKKKRKETEGENAQGRGRRHQTI